MIVPIRNNRIRLPQGQIFWREVGKGPTIIFLHGAWWTSEQWMNVIESLSSHYHCIAPDLIGFGESEQPRTHYSIQFEVESLAAYLDMLRIRRCILVGYGIGAWIAASYALKYPDQVSKIIVAAPEGVTHEKLQGRWRGWSLLSSPFPLIGSFLQLKARLLKILAKVLGRNQRRLVNTQISPKADVPGFSQLTESISPEKKTESMLRLRRMLRQSPAACQLLFRRRATELEAEYLQDRLFQLKTPMLILQATQDSPDVILMAQLYAQVPHAVTEVVPELCVTEPWKYQYALSRNGRPKEGSSTLDPMQIHGAIASVIEEFISN